MDNQLSPELQEYISLARLALTRKQHFGFFTSLLYKFKFSAGNTQTIALDAINKVLHVNPDWFMHLPMEHAASVLAHEMLHYALQHDIRLGRKDPKRFQEASDEVVNNILDEMGFELPPSTSLDKSYSNKSVEEVYQLILQKHGEKPPERENPPNTQAPQSNDSLGNDLSFNSPSMTSQNQRNSDVAQAELSNKMANRGASECSSMGNVLEQFFEDIKAGKLAWNIVLQEHLDSLARGEPSFAKLNRRMLPLELYLPDNVSENHVEKIAIAFDVSGSVSVEQIDAFLREMNNVKEACDPEIMEVITFNHDIVQSFKFEQDKPLKNIQMKVGGGTSLFPVFEYFNDPKNRPKFLIVFSDLECKPITEEPSFDTVWVCIDNPEAKVAHGKLIHITSEELINE